MPVDPSAAIALGVSTVTLGWQGVQFFLNRTTDAHNRQFEAYHRLIKELVQPSESGVTYVDRQCAALYEIPNFKRYRPLSLRILQGLREDWKAKNVLHPRLAKEIELAVSNLKRSAPNEQ